jgi:hypothetical protein
MWLVEEVRRGAELPADVKVIPGHGDVSRLDDVRAFVRMLKETSAAVQKAIDERKTVEQMKQEKILEPWKRWSRDLSIQAALLRRCTTRLPDGRTKGEFVKHNQFLS